MSIGFNGKTVWQYRTANFPNIQPITAMAWIRCDTLTELSNVCSLTLSGSDDNWCLMVSATGQLSVYVSPTQFDSGAGLIRVGKWHHVCFTYGDNLSADLVQGYLDGKRVVAGTQSIPAIASNRFSIGRGNLAFSIVGGKQHFRFWNRELAPNEVALEARWTWPPHAIESPDLYAWYPRCDGSGNIRDWSGNNRDLATSSGATVDYDEPPNPSADPWFARHVKIIGTPAIGLPPIGRQLTQWAYR